MNSSVTLLSDTSVISSSCLAISDSSRSKGPLKLLSDSEKTAGWAASVSAASSTPAGLGDGATGDQFSRDLPIGLGGGVLGGEGVQRRAGDRGIRELHRAPDDRLEHAVAEGLDDA